MSILDLQTELKDKENTKLKFKAQSFTSLKTDFRQDITEVLHLAVALMELFLEGSAPLRFW